MKKLLLTLALLTCAASAMAYPPSIDYVCFNKCLSAGSMYGYCQKVCSY